ncbi:MAG: metallophosphoesterase [Candidatus Cloacimonetes bacterium 4572_65]|nr:MAG: metallophosphoesterase [Candidatus Cloacimonetes bacterium 4572_65]
MNILFLGDIFGKPGREILKRNLKNLRKEFSIDMCIANFENLADGKGVTEKTAKIAFSYGVDFATGGNHLWSKSESLSFISKERRICRPANYPRPEVGREFITADVDGHSVTILNLVGQNFMTPANSPFFKADEILDCINSKIIIVDFHAEATAEKRALAWHLDGRVSALFGTHTHIQTADEEILPQGTGYITDVGMTGGHDSVIGIRKEIILSKMRDGLYRPYLVANRGLQINGIVVEVDNNTGKTLKIKRVRRCFNGEDSKSKTSN